jgi:hypothetical protein
MGSIEEVRAGIAAANELASEALGAAQQCHASLEQAQGALMRAVEGSGQADVTTAVGLAAQSVNDADQLRQLIAALISESESISNRL